MKHRILRFLGFLPVTIAVLAVKVTTQPAVVGDLRRVAEEHQKTVVPVNNQVTTRIGTAGSGR